MGNKHQVYYKLEEMIDMIDSPNREACMEMMQAERDIFHSARGSKANHQAWQGGYLDHLSEVMNIGIVLHGEMGGRRSLDFSLSDLLLVLFLHDLEKPWKYIEKDGILEIKEEFRDRKMIKDFVYSKISKYGFVLSDLHHNGLQYVEGERESYTPDKRQMMPIAAMAHMCDVWSARGWPDYPLAKNSWL